MKITFMTTLGRNVGDEFIRAGIKEILSAAGVSYNPLYVCKHDLTTLFRPVEDETVLPVDKFWKTDLFIQCGAPVWWRNRDGTSSLTSDWYRYLWEDRILTGKRLFWNLGAGSCQAWDETEDAYLSDAACTNFARQSLEVAKLTTVRDLLAKKIAGDSAHLLACPALFAARGWKVQKQNNLIGLNFMPLGCHHDLDGSFDADRWKFQVRDMVSTMRRRGRLLFIAHDSAEAGFMQQFAESGERVFWARGWREYMEVYGACSAVIANRVHGAICAAGFGTPAVILGNDSRAFIGCAAGVPVLRSNEVVAPLIGAVLESFDRSKAAQIAERDFNQYVKLIKEAL